MKKFIIFLSISIISTVTFSASQPLPKGFEEYFEFEISELKVRNLNGTFSTPISFLTKFDTVKLNKDDKQALREINEFLIFNSISMNHRDEMVKSLIVGVKDSGLCKGKLSECEVETDTYHWVFNQNDKQLYLFIHPSLLDYNSILEEGEYHHPESESNGVINYFDLYVNQYNGQESTIAFNDVVTVGLPYGYIKADFSLNSVGDDSLNEAAYHLDLDGYAMRFGYLEYDSDINSTGFINGIARMPQKSVTFASSERLLIGGKKSDQRISFYAPVSGAVIIYRDGRIIYQKNIKEGQNKVFYNELPMGRYEVKLDVVSSGNVLNSYIYQVYNSAQDTLAEGKIDYLLSAGFLSESTYSDNYSSGTYIGSISNLENVEDDAFGKALISYQATQSLLLGAGSTFTDNGQSIAAGITYHWMYADMALESVYTVFNDATHFRTDLGLKRFNVSYETLNDGFNDPLAKFMYGPADYSHLSVSSSYRLGRSNSLYFFYRKGRQENVQQHTFPGYYNGETRYQTVSLGYSSPFYFGSKLDLNIDYTDVNDEVSLDLLWSIPLSKTVDLISGMRSSDSDVQQISTSIRKDNVIDTKSFDGSMELRNVYHRGNGNVNSNMEQQALMNMFGGNDYGRLDISAYTSTQAQHGVTMSISSTQVITGEGINFSDKKSSSYVLVDVNKVDGLEENIGRGSFSLTKDNKQNKRFIVYKDTILVPIQDYYQYKAYFDSESVDLFNSGDSYSNFFSHPGTVATLKTKVSRVVSFVSAFNDLNDQPIKDISCDGVGCLRLNKVVDGVYRVTVLEGASFELSSMSGNIKQRCLLPYELSSTELMNFGSNYCLPMESTSENIFVNVSGEVLKVRFIGVYGDLPGVSKALNKLEELGYIIIQRSIGKLKAIYVAQADGKINDMYVKHKKLFEELKVLAKRNYATDVINYPIVKSSKVIK